MQVMEMRDAWGVDHIKPGTRPDPSPGPGQVLIKMQAASVNYRDLVMTERGYGRHSGELPLIPLSDGAGTVAETGAGVTRVKIGDLVCPAFAQLWVSGVLREEYRPGMLGGPLDGVMQEYMVLPEAGVVKAPAHLSAIEAATLPCAALTAWSAVVGCGVKPGDVVVTQGTGGVSLFALLFAKLAGATTIITSSSDEKLARATALGADIAINYRTHPEWSREIRQARRRPHHRAGRRAIARSVAARRPHQRHAGADRRAVGRPGRAQSRPRRDSERATPRRDAGQPRGLRGHGARDRDAPFEAADRQ
jgi:NADPH:quinone reductase-like Zn-dependent oxidoreductase